MKTCIITVGISASGKTTWAEKYCKEMEQKGEKWVNVNRDDIRKVVHVQKTRNPFSWETWDFKWEKIVNRMWKEDLEKCADSDVDGVISSDTNINANTRDFLSRLFTRSGWVVELKHFPIDYKTAVERDRHRSGTVGAFVIASQIEKYWKQFGKRYTPNTDLPKAVIVDIDGTLAHATARKIYDFARVKTDTPDEFAIAVVKGLASTGKKIVCLTGRNDSCREDTMGWLIDNLGFEPDELFMRKTGDNTPDDIVKKDFLFDKVEPKYNVIGVIDDRPKVVRMWTSLGIRVMACGFQSVEF